MKAMTDGEREEALARARESLRELRAIKRRADEASRLIMSMWRESISRGA